MVFRALKNVFEPMLVEPAAVPTRMPAQASLMVLPLTTLLFTGPQLLMARGQYDLAIEHLRRQL
jgi:hypothetical protein